MKSPKLHIEPLPKTANAPFDLLELADPSRNQIEKYLRTGSCYVAKVEEEVVGVLVLHSIDAAQTEIKNIAVREAAQGKGIGSTLLRHAVTVARTSGFERLIIGTGNSSIRQLALYQKAGFELCRIERDFFVRNYPEPIFENGIQCKHLVVLEMTL